MTSQHFDDGWENWGDGDWSSENINNNNNSQQIPQQNQQFVQQQQQPPPPSMPPMTAPIYSPFSYSQNQPPTAPSTNHPQNPFSKPPSTQHIAPTNQQYVNPVNFFNPATQHSYNDGNSINNNNNQYSQPYSLVQSPITSSVHHQNAPQFDKIQNYQYHQQDVIRRDSNSSVNTNPYGVQQPAIPQSNLPPISSSNDPGMMSIPSMPAQQQQQQQYSAINNNITNQVRNATPPTLMQNYDTNFNAATMSTPSQQQQPTYQYSQWNDEPMKNDPNWQEQQQHPASQNSTVSQPMPTVSSQNLEWQNIQAPSSASAFFSSQPFEMPQINDERQQTGHVDVSVNQPYQPPPPPPVKFENIENVQNSAQQKPPSAANMTESITYPENRERLDDVVPPPSVSVSQNSFMPITSAPSLDRHNYLVTGQLSQEFQQPAQQDNVVHESFNENQIPPGLSRMVVGEPENSQQQAIQQTDVLPPRSNRMVTGNEMTPTSFMNYQRQADGEVSNDNTGMQRGLPSFVSNINNNNSSNSNNNTVDDSQSQSFNISDRNLYLVAGESDANSQRVITGVESNPPSSINVIMNPLQNLHIEDDEDFVNISVTTQMSRNVDGDGMEEAAAIQQQNQMRESLENSEQREEEIEGANESINNPVHNSDAQQVVSLMESSQPQADPQTSSMNDIREDIEGGNDVLPTGKPVKPIDFEEKRKSIDSGGKAGGHRQNVTMSSEDSELRELEKNMKSKSRRSKKYDDDSNDSESPSLDEYKGGKKSRDRYDERYRKDNRDRIRDEYERYKRKEKERRSGGRSKRNDDTDGSTRYGDSRRRSDNEDDDRRRSKNKRNDDDVDRDKGRDKKDRKQRSSRPSKDDYDDRKSSRRSKKYYDDHRYPSSGVRSHNSSDREYDRDYRPPGRSSRGPYEMPGYYQPSYSYDPNYYYQYSEKINAWLEQVRMTNPQAYEWYKSYYSGILQKASSQMPPQPTMDDIGGSLRSGYNSGSERASTSRFLSGGMVTNPLRSLNSSFIDNPNEFQSLQQSFQAIGKDFNQAYSSLNYNKYDIYGGSRAKTSEATASGRMTPQKFQCLHDFVRLTNGLMITVDTYNTDDKYSVKIKNVNVNDTARRLYQSYPGPLIRGVSHKKTVIEFCEDKMKQMNSQIDVSLRSSYGLLWSYLILMIRQNGSYTEHDIAELLMKNYEQYKSSNNLDEKSTNNHNNNEIDDENVTDVSESDENVSSEHNSNSAGSNQVSTSVSTEQVVLDKFKSFLLYGNIHDALDYATDNNLWGHALFLASKVDRRQHANVMLKFANKLSYNDPLQTLYQIMSGRMPACVTNLDDKWGDWRPHLAMIISNCTDKPDLVKRSILALGDTLASRGDIYGSQFCYLLMDPQFTDYSDAQMSHGKIALLGTTVQKSFNEFSSNDSIIMTEVYEYARSLNTENYFIVSLQKYKYLLATDMLDYGLKLKCLLYMEQIAKCIIQQPSLFDNSFVSKIYSLADRLKFYDPVMEKLYEDNTSSADVTEDQQWLQDLAVVLKNQAGFSYNEPQYNETATVPTYSSNDIYNPVEYNHQSQHTSVYDPISEHPTPTHLPTLPATQQQSYEEHDANQYNYSNNNFDQQNQVPVTTYQDQNVSYNQHYQMQEQQNYSYGQNDAQQQNTDQQQQNYLQSNYEQNAQYQQNDYDNKNSYGWDQPKPTITMGATHKAEDKQKKPESKKNNTQEDKSNVTEKKKPLWQKLFNFPKQMILPDDKDPSIVWDETAKKWINKDEDPSEAEAFKPPPKMGEIGGNLMAQQVQNNQQSQTVQNVQQPMLNVQQQQHMQNVQQQPMQNVQQQQQPIQNVQQQQPMQNVQQSQSFMQPSQFTHQNQQPNVTQHNAMNQNPMQNHVTGMTQQSHQISQNSTEEVAASSAPSAPNMFKMQKGRNLKKSYVDILGNAGKTVSQPKELAPQMDMQFFNPTQQPQGMQFYNPNDFQ